MEMQNLEYKMQLGQPAPDFSLKGVDGKTYSLSSFREKAALLVVFSCNHCPYVQAYEERLIQIAKDFGPRGLGMVAINSNDEKSYPEDSFEEMVKRSKALGFNFPYLWDPSQDVARAYGAVCTPHVLLFDKNRTLRYQGRVDDSKDPKAVKNPELRNAIEALIGGKPVSVALTRAFGCSIKWAH